jgi:hypothetical protein
MTHVLIPVVIDQNFSRVVGAYRSSDLGYILEPKSAEVGPPSMMGFILEKLGDGRRFYLHDDIGEWLLEHGVQSHKCKLHWLGGDPTRGLEGNWTLSVPDNIALLFKLTWGGK